MVCNDKNFMKNISSLGVQARNKVLLQKENETMSFLNNKMNNPEDTLYLARICGFLCGDGNISVWVDKNKHSHHEVRFFPDDLEMAFVFIDTFEKFYGKRPSLTNRKNFYSVLACSKVATKHLRNNFVFGVYIWRAPMNILNSDVNKIEFIRAFFDCEAHVGKRSICVQSVCKEGLLDIKEMLFDLGINSKIYMYKRKNKNWKDNYLLFIIGKENIIKYHKLVGFNHSVKAGMAELVDALDLSIDDKGESRKLEPF